MTGPDPDLDALLDVALEAAAAGADTALGWLRRRDTLTVEHKSGPSDLVSQADRDTEDAIRAVLARRRPQDTVLGEEGGAHGYREGEVVWVVDPVDGTTNYLYGLDAWAVSVAAVRTGPPGPQADAPAYGEVLAGVVVEPMTGRTTRARAGGGTWCEDRRCAVREESGLEQALVEVGLGHGAERRYAGPLVGALTPRVRDVRRGGSAVTALAMVATGRADGYWGPTVRVWDVAAGVLLVREAGGVVGDLSGPAAGGGTPPSGSLLASTPALFEPLREVVAPVYAT